ncbi:hypothetical protein AFL01nite_18790 [Aeromicrobium flavum]|uniref:Uncharacterized protein n=1 Tax=Aeromicrobium flavum TaxID=416568 RepID=A0A512HVT0_9ACTN|nr:hypothetical protein [Aeromicrobium flavum]GEO89552.1 hypothetical protein AFL01nite_18790 [Aeromicrobium flavum]
MFGRLFKTRTRRVPVELSDEERQVLQSRRRATGAMKRERGKGRQTPPTGGGPNLTGWWS